MALETKPWDSAEFLKDEEDVAGYLKVCLEDDELPEIFGNAIAVAARARGGFAHLSHETGVPEAELRDAVALRDARALPTLEKVYKRYAHVTGSRMVA